MPAILFVHLGRGSSRWLLPNAVATRERFGVDVIVGSDQKQLLDAARVQGLEGIHIDSAHLPTIHQSLSSQLSPRYRQGFWIQTTRRLFALSALHEVLGQRSLIHIESDVYLMPQLDLHAFDSLPKDLAFGLADPHLGSGAIMFSRTPQSTEFLTQALAQVVENPNVSNDMEALLQVWQNHGTSICVLPTLPPLGDHVLKSGADERTVQAMSQLSEHFGGIFDVSCIGQYLIGSDGRNTRGIVNRFSDPAAIAMFPSRLDYRLEGDSIQVSVSEFPDRPGELPLLSLHIHSKQLSILGNPHVNWGSRSILGKHTSPESRVNWWAFGQWVRDSLLKR